MTRTDTVAAMPRRTKASHPAPTRTKPAPVARIKPDPEVYAKALELAAGDARRLVIEGPGVVLVRNGWHPIH